MKGQRKSVRWGGVEGGRCLIGGGLTGASQLFESEFQVVLEYLVLILVFLQKRP